MNLAAPAAAAQAVDAKPELLRDLAALMAHQLAESGLEPAQAGAIAETVAEYVRDAFGGQLVYVPKGAALKTRQRWDRMWADFTGHNHADLARKYGMGVHGVYRVLAIKRAEHRKRAQPDMFEDPNPAKLADNPKES